MTLSILQILAGLVVTAIGTGGLAGYAGARRASKTTADDATVARSIKLLDETREEVSRHAARMIVIEGQYRDLWNEKVAIQAAHGKLAADHARLTAEHGALMAEHAALAAERGRWRDREAVLEGEVRALKARVLELEQRDAGGGSS